MRNRGYFYSLNHSYNEWFSLYKNTRRKLRRVHIILR